MMPTGRRAPVIDEGDDDDGGRLWGCCCMPVHGNLSLHNEHAHEQQVKHANELSLTRPEYGEYHIYFDFMDKRSVTDNVLLVISYLDSLRSMNGRFNYVMPPREWLPTTIFIAATRSWSNTSTRGHSPADRSNTRRRWRHTCGGPWG